MASKILGEHLRANRVFYGEIDEESGRVLVERDFVREGTPSALGQHSMEVFAWLRSSPQKHAPTVVKDVRTSETLPEADRAGLAEVQAASVYRRSTDQGWPSGGLSVRHGGFATGLDGG